MIPGAIEATSKNALETRNLALNSTFVVQGTCWGVTFAIGDRSIMGRIVAMSGETKFKLTTVQREVWFFTKIVSALALSLFTTSLIVWAAWLRKSFPGFETASGAIINSIGCLTAFVPQVWNIFTLIMNIIEVTFSCRDFRCALHCPSLLSRNGWLLDMYWSRTLQPSKL